MNKKFATDLKKINQEIDYLVYEWRDNIPKEGEAGYKEYLRDQKRFFFLKGKIQCLYANRLFRSKPSTMLLGTRRVFEKMSEDVLAVLANFENKRAKVLLRKT